MRAKSRVSVQKYTQLIISYNTQIINLNNAIKEYGIAKSVKGWVETGVAIPAAGNGMYRIVSNNPKKDAVRILTANHNYNMKLKEEPKKSKKPERRPTIIEMQRIENPQTDKPKKKISILWGMITIEQ